MSKLQIIGALMKKEIALELKTRYAISSLGLFVLAVAFLVYYTTEGVVSQSEWWSYYWIILVFVSIQAVVKSFLVEHQSRQYYLAQLASPAQIILSKTLYHILLLFLCGLLIWGVMALFLINPVKEPLQFLGILFLGSTGIAGVFTLFSGIASRASGNFTILAVMCFPIMIPFVKLLVSQCKAMSIQPNQNLIVLFLLLALLDVAMIAMGMILFPYIWRE